MEKLNNFASMNFKSILGHTHIINRGKQSFTMTFKVRGQGHNANTFITISQSIGRMVWI